MKRTQYVIWHAPTNTFYKGMSWGKFSGNYRPINIRTVASIDDCMMSPYDTTLSRRMSYVFANGRSVFLKGQPVHLSEFVIRAVKYELVP